MTLKERRCSAENAQLSRTGRAWTLVFLIGIFYAPYYFIPFLAEMNDISNIFIRSTLIDFMFFIVLVIVLFLAGLALAAIAGIAGWVLNNDFNYGVETLADVISVILSPFLIIYFMIFGEYEEKWDFLHPNRKAKELLNE